MQTIARTTFTTVKTEGGLLPADLLQRIADGRDLPGLRAEDYHLLPGERLNEAINRAWNRCLGAWLSFGGQRRVHTVSKFTDTRCDVRPQLPVDVLGIYVLLPAVS
jgi:hypothetical protein